MYRRELWSFFFLSLEYVQKIFTINMTRQVITNSNLGLPLKLFFCLPITADDFLPPKIYCKNIIKNNMNVAFLNFFWPKLPRLIEYKKFP